MMDDSDLDDAALWAVIDSAAASRSRKPHLTFKTSSHHHAPPKPFRNPRPLHILDHNHLTPPADGEVVQEELGRPYKIARFVDALSSSDHTRMVVLRQPQRSPVPSSTNSYLSPDVGRVSIREVSPLVESPSENEGRMVENKENVGCGFGGRFSSVSAFKEYQNVAMAILDKSDYTMISGKPYIKKSGWRKISCFFNLSYEIKDKSIEFDDKKNVQRAEFVVRAHMQSGRFSDGWGSCERREKNFSKPNHDIPSTAETRAKNKACQDLLGIGEVRPGVVNSSR